MGTHPIFESDFDCLTENVKMSEKQQQQDANLTLVSSEDLAEIDRAQRDIGMRFEKSNEMLKNCNAIMANHMAHIGHQLTEHAKTIGLFKSDLGRVYGRIRQIKSRIRTQYPDEPALAEADELERMPPPADN